MLGLFRDKCLASAFNLLLFLCRLNFGNFGARIFHLTFYFKLNHYLNFSSGLADAAACSKLSGSLSCYRNFLHAETANFRFTKNCTLPKSGLQCEFRALVDHSV